MRTTLRILAMYLTVVAVSAAAFAGFEEERRLTADQLLLRNLIGRVEVRAHDGADFLVALRVEGRDATPERVTIDVTEGRYAEVIVEFPVGETRHFVYPELGRGSKVTFNPDGESGGIGALFGLGRQIEVTGGGSGLELWVDVTVSVPRGKTLKVEHGAGKIHAEALSASLDLTCHSCPIEVDGLDGPLTADTGSGSIVARDVRGEVSADTGSGDVRLSHCRGERIHVDTGSGEVEIEGVEAERVVVDTGSGGVDARGVGADEMTIDTGSGGVHVELVRMGHGTFKIDTGSGGVHLRLPAGASAEIVADTGSGGVRFEPSASFEVVQRDEDSAVLRVGAGDARVRVDTGSGGIRISL